MNGRALVRAMCGVGLLVGGVASAQAQDRRAVPKPLANAGSSLTATEPLTDLESGEDFRVRVTAAATLVTSTAPGVREALERALQDSHPAVRSAAANSLALRNELESVPALRAAQQTEQIASVRAQLESAQRRLSPASQPQAKRAIAVLSVEDKAGALDGALRSSRLKERIVANLSAMPGMRVMNELEQAEAMKRRLVQGAAPLFGVDAILTELNRRSDGSKVRYTARVDYVIRMLPDQTLKGSVSGTSTVAADLDTLDDPRELADLEMEAVEAAVASGIRSVTPALEAALLDGNGRRRAHAKTTSLLLGVQPARPLQALRLDDFEEKVAP